VVVQNFDQILVLFSFFGRQFVDNLFIFEWGLGLLEEFGSISKVKSLLYFIDFLSWFFDTLLTRTIGLFYDIVNNQLCKLIVELIFGNSHGKFLDLILIIVSSTQVLYILSNIKSQRISHIVESWYVFSELRTFDTIGNGIS
jgi:hypothetical protein